MLVCVSPSMCLELFFTAQRLNVCLFPRGVILKTTFCYLKPKWRKKARVCKSAHSRMPESHWLLAEDICMGTIGQVKGRYCDGCPLCKALCAQVGSFEWFLMMAPWAWDIIPPGFQIRSWKRQTCIVNCLDEFKNVCLCLCVCKRPTMGKGWSQFKCIVNVILCSVVG